LTIVGSIAGFLALVGAIVSWGLWSRGGAVRWTTISITIALVILAAIWGKSPRYVYDEYDECGTGITAWEC